MFDRHTLRGRLTLAYAFALVAALVLFGLLALAIIDDAQRSALDARLATSARATLAIVDAQRGRVMLDEVDTVRLGDILGANANGAVWQRDGTTVTTSGRGSFPGLRERALAATAPGYLTIRAGTQNVRAYVTPVLVGTRLVGAIAIWRETDAIAELDRAVALAFAIAIPVLAGIAVLFGSAIARRALAPLAQIATLASEIEAHDLSARLALPSRRDELGRLAATFDRMLDRLQRGFERERRFTSDASHELRAPLSVIRAEADLALRHDRSGDEYRRALRTIAEDADALEAITRNLLHAARAGEDGGAETIFSLASVAHDAASAMTVLAAERGVTIDVSAEKRTHICGTRDALNRAAVAVIHNAIKYARDGGSIHVDVAHDGDDVELRVSDDGPGFSAAAFEHGFERFWRGDDVRVREGSGLGLAIVRSIVIANGGTVTLANDPRGGAVVRMRFPHRR